jgi:hemoglobin/transferrin/lactoferrin receptor protein
MCKLMKRRLASGASALAMSIAGATVGALTAQAQQAPTAPPTEVTTPPGTILSPIVVKTPRSAGPGPSVPASQPGVAASATPTSLDALSSSGDKAAATVYDSPGTVTVKSTAEMERQNINNARDFVRDEPGISVGNQPGRTGATNFVIRGVGDNRVRLEIDGVKVPDFPGSNLGASTYTRDFIDYDALKRVEIIRGPASALYGSDALGGVVSFITKDPADYLDLVGKNWYFSTKGAYDSADHSISTTNTGASRIGNVESMLLVTRRWGHEVEINSDKRSANPQDYMTTNVLGKVVYKTIGAGELKLTGEYFTKSVETNLQSENGYFPTTQFAKIFDGIGDDESTRRRISLDWNLPVNWFFADAVKTRIYNTSVHRTEDTRQLSAAINPGPPVPEPTAPSRLRLTDLIFDQDIVGGEIQASATRSFWGASHFFTYGATVDFTSTTRPRDRTQITLATGASTKTVGQETFPNKNFPDTDSTQAAVYFQDIAQWGALRIIPAIRFDYFGLQVSPDALFARSNIPGFKVEDQQETAISPKLGATYDLDQNYRMFGQYARGFRAPPYDSTNFGYRNNSSFYEILPNGNLKPETSDGFEAGLRGKFKNGSSFQLSAFYNMYQDYIDTVTLAKPPAGFAAPPPGFIQFQYQNIGEVSIRGYEGKGEWRFMPEWALFGSVAIAWGQSEETGAPLDSVDPLTGVAGIRYRSLYSGWGGEFRGRYAAKKDAVSQAIFFQPDGHSVYDALVSYEIAPAFSFNAGVFNLFNASYFNAQDVVGVQSTNANLELFRATGRSFSANATFRW